MFVFVVLMFLPFGGKIIKIVVEKEREDEW